ncbi:MAG: hypothetical protein HUU50_20585 [Candidatus Brocadiae bacterium]|nr:hypothetical protein [Candidatus Brocadiia bacterium]
MIHFAKDIFQLATTVLTDITVSGGDGLIGGAIKQVQEYFRTTDSLKKYYDLSVDRSILSLEIAMKGPRAYYPTREKEFYQKHFSHFEKQIFAPFSLEVLKKGMVKSEEELRIQCVNDCEKIKKKAPAILQIQPLAQEDIQKILQDSGEISSQISEDMLREMKKTVQCTFMIPLLEKNNVLLSGIVFHFHNFIQADPNFSNYMNYMELSQIKKNLGSLTQSLKKSPDNTKLQARIQRLEKFITTFASYDEKMGAIGKKLDDIYEKTIQTYEVLERLESQMQSNFSVMEERLKAIYDLILTKKENPEENKPTLLKEKPEKNPVLPVESQSLSPQPVFQTPLPHKHKFHVMPNASIFGSLPKEENAPSETHNTIHDSLKIYSLFLQESEKESPTVFSEPENKQSFPLKKIATFPWLNPEKHNHPESPQKESQTTKSRLVKCDKVSSIFTKDTLA